MREAAFLNVIGGADRGKQYELVLPETRIGRGADQDLVLADIAVSRRHITIHAEGGRFRLRDLGSGNGTLLNGQRIDSVIMNDGDQIELGNTLMRFDHAASRAAVPGAPSPMPSSAGAPPPYASPSAAPVYSGASHAPPTAAPSLPYDNQGYTPSDSVERPPPPPMTDTSLPQALQRFASPQARLVALGSMGALCLIALIVIIARTATAKPQIVTSQAEELYRRGLKLFVAKDYEGAKVDFTEAAAAAPDSADAKRYVAQCDAEAHASRAMTTAEHMLSAKRYGEAIKSLDAVDSISILHDQAVKLRKDNAPRAAQEAADEARNLVQDDPETAKLRIAQALALDPTNADARQLAGKLHMDVPPLPVGFVPPAPAATPAPTPVATPTPKPKHVVKDDNELAAVKVKAQPKVDAPSSSAALTAYRAHDFATAERIYRQDATKQPPKVAEKTLAYAGQVHDLKTLVDKATADENKNAPQASKEYDDAMALDTRIGHGANTVWFKQRIARLQLPLAQQAFAAGRYDQAYDAAVKAQKLGGSDGGVLAKLEAKAQELTNKGIALQKSSLPQAKQYWRQVLKMVPAGSPTYNKAYTLVNNSGGPHRDEDED